MFKYFLIAFLAIFAVASAYPSGIIGHGVIAAPAAVIATPAVAVGVGHHGLIGTHGTLWG